MVAREIEAAPTGVEPGPEPDPPTGTRDPSRIARRLGLAGTLLMAVGGLGAGALPVPNPMFGLRLLGLPARNVTIALAVCYTGIIMLVLAWLWIGKMLHTRGAVPPAPTRAQLTRTAVLWAIPLAIAPPLFSRDVYSYLAQSATLARGLDPYVLGPAQALGVDDPLTRSIPTIWRDTPAPYGPLFLILGRVITALSGNNIVLGIFEYRILSLAGLGLILWALPRLARRCGIEPGLAMWLVAASPPVLFHLVSGMHNEAIMIGLMLAGIEIGLRSSTRITDPKLLGGALLIIAASGIKLPAILALGFLGLDWARRRSGRIVHAALVAGVFTGLTVAVYVPLSVGTGVGIGWLRTLSIPSLINSWMSVTTDIGMLSGQIGILAGMGDHTEATLAIARSIGFGLAGLIVLWLLHAVFVGKLDAVTGVGAGLGAVVLLGPVVHPWYLLWAVIPLAATRELPRYRRAALAAAAVLALIEPPTGADFNFRAFQLPLAIAAGLVLLVGVLVLLRRHLAGQTGFDIETLPGRGPATPTPAVLGPAKDPA